MIDFNKVQQLIIESGSNLEKIELGKRKVKILIEKILYNSDILPVDKLKLIEDAWKIYIDYDENIIPFALNNIRNANQLLKT